jgi:hypothetical protein
LRLGRDGMSSDDEPSGSGAGEVYRARTLWWREKKFSEWMDKIDEVNLRERSTKKGSGPRRRTREGGQPSRRRPCQNLPKPFYSKELTQSQLESLTTSTEVFPLMWFSPAAL